MKLMVLVPGGVYTPGFYLSSVRLGFALAQKKGWEIGFHNLYSPVVYEGRNRLLLNGQKATKDAKPFGFDYDGILWLETDMVFDPEDAFTLIESGCDYISALYSMGPSNPTVAVAGWYKEGKQARIQIPVAVKSEEDIMEVDYTGLGFVYMKAGVLEKIGYPWFHKLYEEQDGEVKFLGDDFSLCNELREKGVKINVHTKVVVGHEKQVVYR